MTDLIDRIRAYVAAIPTHRCDGCALDFTSETMTCPSCGIADRTRWVADSEANRLLREVAALEPVAFGFRNSAFPGGQKWMLIRENIPENDQYGGRLWSPLYTLTGATHE